MICHVCGNQASGQCKNCGKFYCPDHGDELCVACAEADATGDQPDVPGTAAPPCYACGAPANRACRCGKFYCGKHGGQSAYGPFCVECYDSRRPLMGFAALVEIGAGIFMLFVANAPGAKPVAGLFVLIALAAFGAACFCGWCAFRSFPGDDEPSKAT